MHVLGLGLGLGLGLALALPQDHKEGIHIEIPKRVNIYH